MTNQPAQTNDSKQPEVIVQETSGEVAITESTLRLSSSNYNEGTRQSQLIHEELNSAINRPIIMDRVAKGTARDLDEEPKHEGEMCFIIGSGPSLDDSIVHLKNWEGGIICSTSHALTLMYHGIEPSHIIALDPFSAWEETKGIDWSKTKTKLIAHPGVWPDLIENWPNELLLYLQNAGDPAGYYNTTQKHMYTTREGKRPKAEFIWQSVLRSRCSPARLQRKCSSLIVSDTGVSSSPVVTSRFMLTRNGLPRTRSSERKAPSRAGTRHLST